MRCGLKLFSITTLFLGAFLIMGHPTALAVHAGRDIYPAQIDSGYFTPSKLKLVLPDELAQKIELKLQDKIKLQVVDLRVEAEFVKGAIPGAVNIPQRKLRFLADKMLVKSEPVVVYGYSSEDKASVNAVIFLYNKGYDQVMLFEGGWKTWESKFSQN